VTEAIINPVTEQINQIETEIIDTDCASLRWPSMAIAESKMEKDGLSTLFALQCLEN
jgi:hypothetical protein